MKYLAEKIAKGQGTWKAKEAKEAYEWLLDQIEYHNGKITELKGEFGKSWTRQLALVRVPKVKDICYSEMPSVSEMIKKEEKEKEKCQEMLSAVRANLSLREYLVYFQRNNGFFSESGTEYVMASSAEKAIYSVNGGKMAKESPCDWDSLKLLLESLR